MKFEILIFFKESKQKKKREKNTTKPPKTSQITQAPVPTEERNSRRNKNKPMIFILPSSTIFQINLLIRM